jgi:hypothetical protein
MEKGGARQDAPSDQSRAEPSDKSLTVALAEFNALRALIASRFQIQSAALFGALTAIGVIAGLAIKNSADHELVLLIPLLSSGASVLYTEQSRRIGITGAYIRLCLWPYLAAGDENLPSWEKWWLDHGGLMATVGDAPGALLFLAASVGTLIYAASAGGETLLWWLSAAATAIAVAFVVAAARQGFRRRRTGLQEDDDPCKTKAPPQRGS